MTTRYTRGEQLAAYITSTGERLRSSSSNHFIQACPSQTNKDISLFANSAIAEDSTLRVMKRIGNRLLNLFGKSFLQDLWHFGVSGGVGDLASLLVAASVVGSVWDLLLYALGDLSMY